MQNNQTDTLLKKSNHKMDILETLYDNPPKSRKFLTRKVSITHKKSILFGSRGCGKSSIIIDYLSNLPQKYILYIDFSDTRVEQNDIQNLQDFINKQGIRLVVLEHFDFQCQLPNVDEIILSSTKTLHIDGFESVFVKPLDFEEFMSFEKKHQNIEHIFNLFANIGSYPAVVLGQEESKYRHTQSILKSFLQNGNSISILKAIAAFQSKSLSIFATYKLLKEKMALSKDTIYKQIEMFENEFYVRFVKKFSQTHSNKKLYFSDFTLKNALIFEKDFLARFENMVFCELDKKEFEIFYTDFIDFYIPSRNLSIICAPFLPPELIKRKFAKLSKELKALDINTLQVITIGNEGRYEQDGLLCEILPFWEWAMG